MSRIETLQASSPRSRVRLNQRAFEVDLLGSKPDLCGRVLVFAPSAPDAVAGAAKQYHGVDIFTTRDAEGEAWSLRRIRKSPFTPAIKTK